jgi:hypothetical protein
MATSNSASDVVHAESDKEPSSFMKLPAELRLDIYHYYFSDLRSPNNNNRTVWSKTEAEYLPLLQTSSQVRREAASIFYEEYIGNQKSEKAHSWVLSTGNQKEWLSRLKAMSQVLAQQGPDVEVSVRLTHHVSTSESKLSFLALRRRLGLGRKTPFGALQLANILCDYLARGLPNSSPRTRLHELINETVKTGWLPRCCFTEVIDGFLIAYNYSPTQREERLNLKGPLGKVDWSGLVL